MRALFYLFELFHSENEIVSYPKKVYNKEAKYGKHYSTKLLSITELINKHLISKYFSPGTTEFHY